MTSGRARPAGLFKALTLLKILLVHAGRPVPRDMLVELLWPGIDPSVGASRFCVVVHTLRQVVEPSASGHRWVFIQSDEDCYSFDTRAPGWLDIEEFRASVARGHGAEEAGALDAATRAYDDAVRLYRGDLLEDEPAAEWCGVEREHLRETFLGVLKRLASLHGTCQ
jgi:DNA-binding SARP family transcriptional activator